VGGGLGRAGREEDSLARLHWAAASKGFLQAGRPTLNPLLHLPSTLPPPNPRISRVFIWCLASWDVLGVYPEATTPAGSYHDPAISRLIRDHNAKMRAAGAGAGGVRPAAAGRRRY
jgi:hypothetical protein